MNTSLTYAMSFADIISNPKLLAQMTQQEHEVLDYGQQIVRLKELMKPAKAGHWIKPANIPF